MENNYFKNYPLPNNNFNNNVPIPTPKPVPTPTPTQPPVTEPRPQLPFLEQSLIENILRLNIGKKANIYMTFTDSEEWRDKIFTGQIENAGRDHIILNDEENKMYYILPIIYLSYITFDEPIEYDPRFARP